MSSKPRSLAKKATGKPAAKATQSPAPVKKLLSFNVFNRWNGAVQFTAQIDCAEDEWPSIKLGLAVKWAVKNGAILDGARLDGARLGRHTLAAGQSWATLGWPDGWFSYTFVTKDGEQRVKIGCQDKTIAEGRAYWANKADRREVFAALDYAEAIGRARGWIASVATRQAAE